MLGYLLLILIHLLTAVVFSPGGSSTVHIYTQKYTERHKQQQNNTNNN